MFKKVLLLRSHNFVEGKHIPHDILTKALGWVNFWPLVQPLLFWKEETIILDKPVHVIIKDIKDDPTLTSSEVTGIRVSMCPRHPA
jgi:hypothetical protein